MRALGKSQHCLNFYEIHETQNSLYIVIELLEGEELFKMILKKGFFPYAQVKMLMMNVLLGLSHCDSCNVMHRDLKPENIILKSKTNVHDIKIVDFGLASFTNVDEFIYSRCGTPGYVAPEIINYSSDSKSKYDSKCDVFSAGILFYILLTGSSPF